MKIEDDIAGGLFSLILGKYCNLSLFGVLPLTAQNKYFCDMISFVFFNVKIYIPTNTTDILFNKLT